MSKYIVLIYKGFGKWKKLHFSRFLDTNGLIVPFNELKEGDYYLKNGEEKVKVKLSLQKPIEKCELKIEGYEPSNFLVVSKPVFNRIYIKE